MFSIYYFYSFKIKPSSFEIIVLTYFHYYRGQLGKKKVRIIVSNHALHFRSAAHLKKWGGFPHRPRLDKYTDLKVRILGIRPHFPYLDPSSCPTFSPTFVVLDPQNRINYNTPTHNIVIQ